MTFSSWETFSRPDLGGCHFCRNRHVDFFVLFLYMLLLYVQYNKGFSKSAVRFLNYHSEVFVTQVSLMLDETKHAG